MEEAGQGGKTAGEELCTNSAAWAAYDSCIEPHKRLQVFARQLSDAAQPNALKPGELRKLAISIAGYLRDVAVDVAFMTPRKPD